ncbi:hypothetical protein E2C01_062563 [Portunus trituberculatus]|uniref:Uncharacterized protein n=1 Tax=Portunus trituberculatus TaxID=210409 RepID=A0A5B7HE11_PORTR|nr:hypothetical protein [Portunus trituberculatus]
MKEVRQGVCRGPAVFIPELKGDTKTVLSPSGVITRGGIAVLW